MQKVRLSPSDSLRWLYEHPDTVVAVDTETRYRKEYDEELRAADPKLKLGILGVADGRSICMGVSWTYRDGDNLYSAYLPINHLKGQPNQEWILTLWKQLRYVLTRQGRTLIFANAQFDFLSLETVHIRVAEQPFYDIATVANIARPYWPISKSLDALYQAYVGDDAGKEQEWEYVRWRDLKTKDKETGLYKQAIVKKSTLKWQKENGWPDTTPWMIESYACGDTEATLLVWEKLMVHPGWTCQPEDLWTEKQKIIRVLTEMKRRGIQVDVQLAAELEAEGVAAKEELLEKLGGLNPSSVKDAPKIFLELLNLPVLKETPKGAPSFTAAVMEEYDAILEGRESSQPEVGYVKAWRGWSTALGLLLRPYQDRVSPDGRLRTSYTTHVTSTGRLSSKEPNLQQISKGANPQPWNDRVKKCFVARPGYVLLSADYSQLELRMAVAYSQEPSLQQVFLEGRDIFSEMAEELGWTRPKTKSFVYATQYGAGDDRISYIFGVGKAEARRKREQFYRKYPLFRKLDMATRAMAESTKKIRLWSGRVRHFKTSQESYKALNALLQGGAADVVERVWVYIMENLDNEDCRALLQVHDALVFEVREDLALEYARKIHDIMVDVNGIVAPGRDEPLFPVKFEVEVEYWGGEKIDLHADPVQAEDPAQREIRKLKRELAQAREDVSMYEWQQDTTRWGV